jgi:hypothetical protein
MTPDSDTVRDGSTRVLRIHAPRASDLSDLEHECAGDRVAMRIAGQVPRAMLPRYFHMRIEGERSALVMLLRRRPRLTACFAVLAGWNRTMMCRTGKRCRKSSPKWVNRAHVELGI